MARSLNKAQLIGNLGQDPDLRTIPSGSSVCTLKVATSERYKDRNGEWQESTEWHTVVLWERLAEVAHQYLKKGSKVFVEGKIQTRTYEKDGQTKYFTEIRGLNLIMLDSKGEGSSYGSSSGGGSYSQEPSPASHTAPDYDDSGDDDVPF